MILGDRPGKSPGGLLGSTMWLASSRLLGFSQLGWRGAKNSSWVRVRALPYLALPCGALPLAYLPASLCLVAGCWPLGVSPTATRVYSPKLLSSESRAGKWLGGGVRESGSLK